MIKIKEENYFIYAYNNRDISINKKINITLFILLYNMSVIIGKGLSAVVFLVSHPIYGPVAIKRYKYIKNDDHERRFIKIHNEVKIVHLYNSLKSNQNQQ